jgi:hypothetical protein
MRAATIPPPLHGRGSVGRVGVGDHQGTQRGPGVAGGRRGRCTLPSNQYILFITLESIYIVYYPLINIRKIQHASPFFQ